MVTTDTKSWTRRAKSYKLTSLLWTLRGQLMTACQGVYANTNINVLFNYPHRD